MDADKRLLEIYGSDSFFMGSKYVTLSLEEARNKTQLDIIYDILESEDPIKRVGELLMEKEKIKRELRAISKSFVNESKSEIYG